MAKTTSASPIVVPETFEAPAQAAAAPDRVDPAEEALDELDEMTVRNPDPNRHYTWVMDGHSQGINFYMARGFVVERHRAPGDGGPSIFAYGAEVGAPMVQKDFTLMSIDKKLLESRQARQRKVNDELFARVFKKDATEPMFNGGGSIDPRHLVFQQDNERWAR